jgi:hypothetical protein
MSSHPTTGTDRGCARAANGQVAAAPPRSLMNWRRFMQSIPDRSPWKGIPHLSGIIGRVSRPDAVCG